MGTQKGIVAFGKPRGRRDGRRRKTDPVSFARHLLFGAILRAWRLTDATFAQVHNPFNIKASFAFHLLYDRGTGAVSRRTGRARARATRRRLSQSRHRTQVNWSDGPSAAYRGGAVPMSLGCVTGTLPSPLTLNSQVGSLLIPLSHSVTICPWGYVPKRDATTAERMCRCKNESSVWSVGTDSSL